MAGETYGAPAGISQAIGDANTLSAMSARNFQSAAAQQLLPGELALQQGQIAMQPLERFFKTAEGKLRQAQAEKAQNDLRVSLLEGDAIAKMANDPDAPKLDRATVSAVRRRSFSLDRSRQPSSISFRH